MHHCKYFRGQRFALIFLLALLGISGTGLAQTSKPKINQATVIDFKDISLKMVIKNLASQLKMNVVFDETFREEPKYELELNDVTVEAALKIVLIQKRLMAKVIEDKTIIIFLDNPNNRARFEEYPTWSVKSEQKR